MELLGIRLVGINAENGQKLLFTALFLLIIVLLRRGLQTLVQRVLHDRLNEQARFWTRQGINLGTTLLLIVGLLSLWFDDPTRLATALGLITAGLAFALQRVVTALAGYVVLLRGETFGVGDRITMGGVRGDVIGLGLIQTTIMEMGQPPSVQNADPAMWVRSRQYTGRIVTVTNDKVFDEPVFNYSREFPYLWEEMSLPIPYTADRERAEEILLNAARRLTADFAAQSAEALIQLQHRYALQPQRVQPRVYYRLTDNWLELTVRFITEVRGVRDVKDAMSREILREFDAAGIELASATFEIVGFPPLRMQQSAVRETTDVQD